MAEPMQMDMQYWGTSDEDKPTNVPKNSIYFELDTCSFYYFDGEQWGEMPCNCNGEDDMTYDIIIETTTDFNFSSPNLSEVTVKKGNPLDLEDKLVNNKIISGLLILHGRWSFLPVGANIQDTGIYLPLTELIGGYRILSFSNVTYTATNNNGHGAFFGISIQYDGSTGEFIHINTSQYTLEKYTP